MDTNLMYVIIVIILAVIAIIALFRFRQRTRIDVQGPFGTGVKVDASNQTAPPTPALKAEDLKANKGGLKAHDETGRGVDVKKVEVEKDIDLKSTANPKAPPPA